MCCLGPLADVIRAAVVTGQADQRVTDWAATSKAVDACRLDRKLLAEAVRARGRPRMSENVLVKSFLEALTPKMFGFVRRARPRAAADSCLPPAVGVRVLFRDGERR